ncbi:MAG: tyrosine-type recombinase/integrase [Bryobacterales bacterium]
MDERSLREWREEDHRGAQFGGGAFSSSWCASASALIRPSSSLLEAAQTRHACADAGGDEPAGQQRDPKQGDKDRFPDKVVRDRAIFELLYGCGLRLAELEGLNLQDFDWRERWIRVRGKGRKEREVPFGGKAAEASRGISKSAKALPPSHEEPALLLHHWGGKLRRLTARSIERIIKRYAMALSGDSSMHPHTLQHAFATFAG